MALRFLDKCKWRERSLIRFGITGKSTNFVNKSREAQGAGSVPASQRASSIGIFAPANRGSTYQWETNSPSMTMVGKTEWGCQTQYVHQCRNLATLGGNQFLGYERRSNAESMQMQIVDALRSGEQIRASSLLADLGQGNHSLCIGDFVHILEYCARLPDPLFALETWRLIDGRKIGLNSRFCLLMVQALCRGGFLEEGLKLLQYLGENCGFHPAIAVYNYVLRTCRKLENAIQASRCLALMERHLVGKNEVTYLELLKLAVWQNNLSAVHEIWKDYIRQYQANLIVLRMFIWSFTRLRDLKSAYETLQILVAMARSQSIFGSRTLEERCLPSRLDVPIPLNKKLTANTWNPEDVGTCEKVDGPGSISIPGHRELKSTGIGVLTHKSRPVAVMKLIRWSFSDVIHSCARACNISLAEQLVEQMQNLGVRPSSHTYKGLVHVVAWQRGFTEGMKLLKIMQERNMKLYASAIATVSVACSKELELDLAEMLLDELNKNKRMSRGSYTHPYNAFFKACSVLNQPERAVQILAKMKGAGIQPDIRTYELLLTLFGNVNPPYEEGNMNSQIDVAKRITAIEKDMAKNGVQHSWQSMYNLLKALGDEGMVTELIHYLQVAENLFYWKGEDVGTKMYNSVLYSLFKAEEVGKAVDIFKRMKYLGVRSDPATYNIMIDCCSIVGCFTSACALLSLMVRDGFIPQMMTYTTLIKVRLEHENFNEGLNLLDHASSDGCRHDLLTFNMILRKASVKGTIDVVEHTLEKMHRENILPDPSTCSFAVNAYMEVGFYRKAMQALQVLSIRMLPKEKMAQYKDLIYDENPEVEKQIIQLFLDGEEELTFALLNLRWLTTLGFSINWSPEECSWAKRLSANYDGQKGLH